MILRLLKSRKPQTDASREGFLRSNGDVCFFHLMLIKTKQQPDAFYYISVFLVIEIHFPYNCMFPHAPYSM